MARQKTYTKSDLSFNDLLRAGLRVPLKDAPAPNPCPPLGRERASAGGESRKPAAKAGKAKRKQVKSGA